MSSDTWVHVLLAVGASIFSAVFSAGVIYTWVKMSIDRLEENALRNHTALDDKINQNFTVQDDKIKELAVSTQGDLSGIGGKVSRYLEKSNVRYHNLTVSMLLIAPVNKEPEISSLLKE